jgi:hypothetical protein
MFASWMPWVVSAVSVAVVVGLRWMVVDFLLDSFGQPPGAGGWPAPRTASKA